MFNIYIVRLHTSALFLLRNKRRVNHIHAFFKMQRTRTPVLEPFVIIYPVCNITRLLCLKNKCAALNRVDTSRINLKKIPFPDRDLTQKLTPPFFLYHLPDLLRILCIMTYDNRSILITVQYVPALFFPQRTVCMSSGIVVVRMHLYTQVVSSINQFCQQREFSSYTSVLISKKFRVFLPHLRKCFPFIDP